MTHKRQLADFIIRFEIGDIAASLSISMVVWVILAEFTSTTFTVLTLVALLINAFIMKRFSYLLDRYAKKYVIQWLNLCMAILILLLVLVGHRWLYLLLYGFCSLYFPIFYSTFNALSQTLSMHNKQIVSATLEITGKLVNLCCAGLIWLFFEPLGQQLILSYCCVLFLLAAWSVSRFNEPYRTSRITRVNVSAKRQGIAWYFSHPITWLVTLAMLPNIIVLQSNTINPIYLYQVLQETPEMLAKLSIAFSIGSLCGGSIGFYSRDEKTIIYAGVVSCAITSVLLTTLPSISMFIIAMGIFGAANSASRVMFRSVIMHSIPDNEAGHFYGIRSSIVSAMQCVGLLSMNISVAHFSPAVTIWFYPAVFLSLPFLFCVAKKYRV